MLSYSLSAMLKICDDFVVEYDVKFKTGKSVAMRIGTRYNMICEPLEHSGKNLQFIQSVKYLGINLVVSYKKIKFSADHVKIKFFMLSTAYTLSVATKCSVGNLLPRICHFGDRLAKGGGGFHHLTLCLTLHWLRGGFQLLPRLADCHNTCIHVSARSMPMTTKLARHCSAVRERCLSSRPLVSQDIRHPTKRYYSRLFLGLQRRRTDVAVSSICRRRRQCDALLTANSPGLPTESLSCCCCWTWTHGCSQYCCLCCCAAEVVETIENVRTVVARVLLPLKQILRTMSPGSALSVMTTLCRDTPTFYRQIVRTLYPAWNALPLRTPTLKTPSVVVGRLPFLSCEYWRSVLMSEFCLSVCHMRIFV